MKALCWQGKRDIRDETDPRSPDRGSPRRHPQGRQLRHLRRQGAAKSPASVRGAPVSYGLTQVKEAAALTLPAPLYCAHSG